MPNNPNPITPSIPYSTWGEIINATGTTGAYLESASTTFTAVLTTIITRVSRAIDEYTLRRFYTSTGFETRFFDGPPWTPDFSQSYGPYAYATWGWAGKRRSMDLGYDIVSISTSSTGSATPGLMLANGTNDAANGTYSYIDPADWYLQPVSRDNWPASWIEMSDSPIGTYSTGPFMYFSPGLRTIKIFGKFGWPSTDYTQVPDVVRQVCVEESIRWFKSRDASFADMTGIAEFTGSVTISKMLSARSRFFLDMYRRMPVSGL